MSDVPKERDEKKRMVLACDEAAAARDERGEAELPGTEMSLRPLALIPSNQLGDDEGEMDERMKVWVHAELTLEGGEREEPEFALLYRRLISGRLS